MTEEPAPEVDVGTFAAVDLRVGRVVDVEPFPEARRPAWKLTIDVGGLGTRRSSAQIAHYAAEELVGRLVVVAVNLGTRRVAGFRSECLVLAAVGQEDGRPRLLRPEDDAAPGDRIA